MLLSNFSVQKVRLGLEQAVQLSPGLGYSKQRCKGGQCEPGLSHQQNQRLQQNQNPSRYELRDLPLAVLAYLHGSAQRRSTQTRAFSRSMCEL